jgi:hypothetical protein
VYYCALFLVGKLKEILRKTGENNTKNDYSTEVINQSIGGV